MPFFKKKPVVIEAQQLTATNWAEVADWCGAQVEWAKVEGQRLPRLLIKTLEGTMTAVPGAWVIKGVKGEFYPCDPEVFDATYNPLSAVG